MQLSVALIWPVSALAVPAAHGDGADAPPAHLGRMEGRFSCSVSRVGFFPLFLSLLSHVYPALHS